MCWNAPVSIAFALVMALPAVHFYSSSARLPRSATSSTREGAGRRWHPRLGRGLSALKLMRHTNLTLLGEKVRWTKACKWHALVSSPSGCGQRSLPCLASPVLTLRHAPPPFTQFVLHTARAEFWREFPDLARRAFMSLEACRVLRRRKESERARRVAPTSFYRRASRGSAGNSSKAAACGTPGRCFGSVRAPSWRP